MRDYLCGSKIQLEFVYFIFTKRYAEKLTSIIVETSVILPFYVRTPKYQYFYLQSVLKCLRLAWKGMWNINIVNGNLKGDDSRNNCLCCRHNRNNNNCICHHKNNNNNNTILFFHILLLRMYQCPSVITRHISSKLCCIIVWPMFPLRQNYMALQKMTTSFWHHESYGASHRWVYLGHSIRYGSRVIPESGISSFWTTLCPRHLKIPGLARSLRRAAIIEIWLSTTIYTMQRSNPEKKLTLLCVVW